MQALSKTIHCGKFEAEAKLGASPDACAAAIEAQTCLVTVVYIDV